LGKKSKSETGPSRAAMPYVTAASSALSGAVNENAPHLANISGTLRTRFDDFAGNMGETLAPAKAYTRDVLGGRYLDQGNPYLDRMIDQTGDSVTDRVNSIFGTAGRTGSGRHVGSLTRGLAEAETGLRYADYGAERDRMDRAVGSTLGLGGAETAELGALLNLGQGAAELPYLGARTLGQGTQGLWGNATTTTQTQGLGQTLAGLAGAGLSGWATGGFKGFR
jgi:hypothetical protein